MVRIDLVRGVAPDKVEDSEGAAGVGSEPGGGDAENLVIGDDEGVACENAGLDVSLGPERKHGWVPVGA